MFFSPIDVFFALCHFTPLNLLLWILKELSRAKKVYSGVVMAAGVYPDSLLAMVVVGMLKGIYSINERDCILLGRGAIKHLC